MIRETAIILPTYNQSKYLDRCLRSLLQQKYYRDFEIICVNDGSTDETQLILEQYRNEITILNNFENKGLPFSVNRAIFESKSRFIVRVDSDDYVSENFLHFLTIPLKMNEEIDAIACDYELIGEKYVNQIVNCSLNPIACGILFRRDQLIEVGLYDENFRIHEDKELMTRFLKKFSVTRLPIPLYRYRMHEYNLTANLVESEKYMAKLRAGENETE